jgi:hypothetical protein
LVDSSIISSQVFQGTKTLKASNVLCLLPAHVNYDIFIFMCLHQSLYLTHASFKWRGGKMLSWRQKIDDLSSHATESVEAR